MGYEWSDKSILIVEDDSSSSYLISEIIKKTKAKISYAQNGNEAVDFIRKQPDTDVIIMDVFLPEKDGLSATKEIKAISSSIYVIAQSAYTHEVNRENSSEAGADEFLPKPLNPGLLLSKINAHFNG